MDVLIGTAGWSLPHAEQARFPGGASHLARYAAVFPVAEINSTFHRPHRASTYTRWRESVPAAFRFSAKLPKTITHELRLRETDRLLATFLTEAGGLGEKLGCLLVQLPPSLDLDAAEARRFFKALRARTDLPAVCEPRHASWFSASADQVLRDHCIARVAADPARCPGAGQPGGWRGLAYFRLHGSPKMYYSAYSSEYLAALAARLQSEAAARPVWCIFDNTTLGAATGNARFLQEKLLASAAAH
jgi:uncharacterized protein YecE (DUF72 family)